MDTLEIWVYEGADGHFRLYSEELDGYNYENGKYKLIPFNWKEQNRQLTVGKSIGDYEGALKKHVFNIVWVSEPQGYGIAISPLKKTVVYMGNTLIVRKPKDE